MLFAAFLVVYIAMLTQGAVKDMYNSLGRLDEEIALNEKKLLVLKAVSNNSGELNAEYAKIFLGRKGAMDSDSLLEDISNIAGKSGINIFDIKPSTAKEEKGHKTYTVKIESQDDIWKLANFINLLTEQQKNMGVQRLQINAKGKEELPRISLVLNAVTFKE